MKSSKLYVENENCVHPRLAVGEPHGLGTILCFPHRQGALPARSPVMGHMISSTNDLFPHVHHLRGRSLGTAHQQTRTGHPTVRKGNA